MTTGLVFDEAAHRYTLDGKAVPGVTGALAVIPNLGYAGVAPEVLAAKALLGNAVHKVVELEGRGELDEEALDPVLVPYLGSWRRFLATSGFRPLAHELRVASRRYCYAGTLDILGLLHGRLALVDAKAVVQVMPSTGPQTAGYELALREWRPDLVPPDAKLERFALQLFPDGRHQLHPFRSPRDARVFLAALTIHQHVYGSNP